MDLSRGTGSGGGVEGRVPHTLAAVRQRRAEPGVAQHVRLADQLAPMVDVWERLLAVHQPDGKGRCRTCTQGGTGLPATSWPCALHGLAALARSRHELAEGA